MPRTVRSRRRSRFIKVLRPLAEVGDDVLVKNCRRSSGQWEEGEVEGITYTPSPLKTMRNKGWWSYRVLLYRKSAAGNPIRLQVGEDGLKET